MTIGLICRFANNPRTMKILFHGLAMEIQKASEIIMGKKICLLQKCFLNF